MKFGKEALISVFMILLMLSVITVGAISYFNDSETSTGNTITAGTLDLTVDDQNGVNVVKFNVVNFKPTGQIVKTWKLTNIGSIGGYLDLVNIAVADSENGLTEPETEAGDTTAGVGELSSLIGLRLFIDLDGNGWYGVGDIDIYNSVMSGVASSYDISYSMPAGSTTYLTTQINWWSNHYGNDNLGQSDSVVLDIGFRLDQTV